MGCFWKLLLLLLLLTDVGNIRGFWWRLGAILAISLIPPYVVKLVRRAVRPPSYRKVQGI